MKTIKKLTAAALAALLLCSFSVTAFAETGKEEVIYVMADSAGKPYDIEAVNIFPGGEITDYGDYSAVKILNTTDEIFQSGDRVNFSSKAERVYYQGTLNNAEIPWKIEIRYFLDGKEYTPEEIAGKSGKLELRFSVSKNENCPGSFYDNYALQASFTLDTEKCKNISYDGATAANVGSDKQLTYTILPGKGIETAIKADVTDFEMASAAINGVKLNMNLDFSVDASEFSFDLSEYTGDISELKDGAKELDDGAGDLLSGAGELSGGLSEIYGNVAKFRQQLGVLSSNSSALNSGAASMADAVFSGATEKLRTGLVSAGMTEEEASAITLTKENYVSVLAALSGGSPTEGQVSLAVEQIRASLSESGIGDSTLQDLAMTLAEGFLSDGSAATISDALTKAGSALSNAAFVKTAAENYGGSEAVLGLVPVLMAEPYNLDQTSAVMIASAAVALDSENPQAKLGEASAMAQDALLVSSAAADENAIRALGSRAASGAILEQSGSFTGLKKQLDDVALFLSSLKTYTNGVDTAASKMGELQSAIGKASGGAAELSEYLGELKDGTKELREKTSDVDTEEIKDKILDNAQGTIDEKIEETKSELFGSEGETVSFVSEKNENVSSVQFVIKTAAVEKPEEPAAEAAPEENPNFLQKLLKLFGIE